MHSSTIPYWYTIQFIDTSDEIRNLHTHICYFPFFYLTVHHSLYTMNIFSSKSGHLRNNCKIFLYFLKKQFQYLMICQSRKCQIPRYVLQNSEKSSNIAKNLGEMKKILQFQYLMIGQSGKCQIGMCCRTRKNHQI